jgi:anti-anti-sigma factor
LTSDVVLRDRAPDPALAPHVKGQEMLGTCNPLGEIDTTTAASFVADLHDAIDDADEAFVNVDCSGLTFIDSAGYHALVDATNYAVRRGHTLVIRNLSPSCARLIRRTRSRSSQRCLIRP